MWFFLKACSASLTSFGLSSTSKISMMCSVICPIPCECEVKCRSLIRLRFGPDAPAVALDNTLYQRQTDAVSFVFFGTVQSLEDPEQFVGIAHIKAHPVVFDEIDRAVRFAVGYAAHFDDC